MIHLSSIAALAARLHLIAGEFFLWWRTALRGLMPVAWRRGWADRRPRLILELGSREAVLRERARGRETELFRGSRDDVGPAVDAAARGSARRVVIALRSELVYRRTVLLPVAAEANLARVIANEIDRQTPFAPGQVYFDYTIAHRDTVAKQIAIDLVVAKRAIIDEAKERVERASLALAAVGIAGSDTEGAGVNLLARHAAGKPSPVIWLNAGLAAAAVMLAAVNIASSLQVLDDDIATLSTEVREARVQAQRAEDLRREVVQLADAGGFLARRKTESSPLVLLREVTARLPDDAWTYEFQVADGQVRIAGYAADAPGLIARLEESDVLRNPKFRAPVTRIANRDIDRFDLSMDVRTPPRGGRP